MRIRTTMTQRWMFFISSAYIIGLITIILHNPLILISLFPIAIIMWIMIDGAVEYEN